LHYFRFYLFFLCAFLQFFFHCIFSFSPHSSVSTCLFISLSYVFWYFSFSFSFFSIRPFLIHFLPFVIPFVIFLPLHIPVS
jgi:hypothetical protein